MNKLKAWVVYEHSPGFEDCTELIYHCTASKARWLAVQSGHFYDCNFLDLGARREPEADCFAKGKPRMEGDLAILRELGWKFLDGQECEGCGLDDMDHQTWRICPECQQCPECGHLEDCLFPGKWTVGDYHSTHLRLDARSQGGNYQ
jgi:hypothetical protein|tara:strand:- start:756 stop:1196 length:441 start_codon:yes stop_codon:yes gene_type:complete